MFRGILFAGVLPACLCFVVADSSPAEAQGLFRRLQDRVRSRIDSIAPPAAPATDSQSEPATQASPNTRLDVSRYGNSVLTPSGPAGGRADSTVAEGARPSLGVSVVPSKDGIPGLKIASVRADSLADEAGLREGDLIIAIDGKPTPAIANVVELLSKRRVGDRVQVTLVRDKTTETISLGLVESVVASAKPTLPPPPTTDSEVLSGDDLSNDEVAKFGISLQQQRGARGLVISEVTSGSPAAAFGMQVGDRMISVDGRLLKDADGLGRALAGRKPDETVQLQLVRKGQLVATEIGATPPAAAPSTAAAEKPGSKPGTLMQGLGSVLGGLLGAEEDAPPAAEKGKQPAKKAADGSVEQAGFEQASEPAAKQLKNDPPSLRGLKIPTRESLPLTLNAPTPAESKQDEITALKEEIRRLQARLKELESQQTPDQSSEQ